MKNKDLGIFKNRRETVKHCLIVFAFFIFIRVHAHGTDPSLDSTPFYFQENLGQMKADKSLPAIFFKAQLKGINIYITEKGLSYLFIRANQKKNSVVKNSTFDSLNYSYERFDIDLKDAAILKENFQKENPTYEHYNFFYGHCPKGISGVKQYSKLTVKNIYQGIDWVLYFSENGGLKYDFIIHPGCDPSKIACIYKSLHALQLRDGNIYLPFTNEEFSEMSPVAFEQNSGLKIKSSFQIREQIKKASNETTFYETQIGFGLESYNKKDILVIDPLQLWWGTYYGGTGGSEGVSVTADSLGNVFVLGNTYSNDLPLQTYGNLAYFQGSNNPFIGDKDSFILKFTNTGQLIWATYIGGNGDENAKTIRCDKVGNIFITGATASTNFPVKNAGGSSYYKDSLTPVSPAAIRTEVFVSKFSNSGQYLWGTYYQADNPNNLSSDNLAVDSQQNIYVVGSTGAHFQFYNPGGGAFFDNTLGSSSSVTTDAFILKFSNSGELLLATYYGGNDIDYGFGVATDAFGNAYFTGTTYSSGLYVKYPGPNGYFQSGSNSLNTTDGFILKLDSNCKAVWATYLGGNGAEQFTGITCDKSGNLFLLGEGTSSDFPIVNPGGGALSISYSAGHYRMIFAKFDAQSQLVWSTRFSGSLGGGNIAIGKCQEVYVSFRMATPCGNCPPLQLMNAGNGAYYDSLNGNGNSGTLDMFLHCFTNSGVLRWGTFYGGVGEDLKMCLAVDQNGDIFYTGDQGSRSYFSAADFQSYATTCLLNPGNGTYFQGVTLCTPSSNSPYCVVGKLTGPAFHSSYITSGCGSTNSASIQTVSGWGPYAYTWSNGSQVDSVANLPQGIYSYTITDNFLGCKENRTFFLGKPSLTLDIHSSNAAVCLGQSVHLSASGANSFSWSPPQYLSASFGNTVIASPLVTTHYTITGYNNTSCKTDSVMLLTVYPLPTITVSGKDSVCKGNSVLLKAAGAESFSWAPANSLSSINSTTVFASPDKNEKYTIVGTDKHTCVDSTIFTVEVIALPQLTISGPSGICSGMVDTLKASGADEFYWRSSSIMSKSDSAVLLISPLKNTTYTLTGINNKMCRDSIVRLITVNNLPEISLIAPDSVCGEISFELKASGSGVFHWSSVVPLSCAYCNISSTSIQEPSLFFVTLTDSNSCKNTDSVSVQIKGDCLFDLIVPNIFTPNNDGANDVFKLRGKNITKISCYIFDRWQTEIFSFDHIDGFWNGINNQGKDYDDGVYYYLITASDLKNKQHIYKGPLQLIR